MSVLPTCQRYGMGVLTWSPLAFGFLTGRYQRDVAADLSTGRPTIRPNWFDPSAPETAAKLDIVEQLVTLADEVGCSLPELAVAFVVAHPAVTSVIVGPRTLEQLEASLKGASVQLDDDVLDRIDEIVAPGTNVYEPNGAWPVPALRVDRRRRPIADRAAA